jgi:hypothetical protein
VLIGISLLTGTAVRLFALIGAAMSVNLWLGISRPANGPGLISSSSLSC